jgi:DHA1 family bicyclomycin/chloramphenicol resistance-like MFS transporter
VTAPQHAQLSIGTMEFIVLAALLTCMTALSIDILLPVLPQLAQELNVTNPNHAQWVVSAYLGGSVVGQLFVGPISDRIGRLPVLFAGLMLFVAGAAVAGTATSFDALLIARVFQGAGGAAPRIMVPSIVRDLYEGRQMARVMSLIMTTFIMVPVFAPSIGQLLGWVAGWRAPIYFLAVMGSVAFLWGWLRLTETSPRHRKSNGASADQEPVGPPISVVTAIATVFRSSTSVGYVAANGCMFGCLMSYILSAQQIFVDLYNLGEWFPVAFGTIAIAMAIAGIVNSRIVVRLGMRHVSHRALAAFVVIAMVVAAIGLSYGGKQPFWLLWLGLWAEFFCFSLIVSNFNAIAMEPLGKLAGTASSVIGSFTTLAGAMLGTAVGQSFNMTTLPLNLGFLIFSATALIIVLITERGRGFGREPTA